MASPLTSLEATPGEHRKLLPDALRLGAVHLKVSELDRSISFYTDVIGLQLRDREAGIASLGVGANEDLIVLHEQPGAHSISRHAGLYHVAILFSSPLELARMAQRLSASKTPIEGASDHGVSEAIYLPDPDGNGLELYADRPREAWPDLSDLTATAPQPLDMGGLFNLVSGREVEPQAGPGTVIGHVHLHVGSIEDGLDFYRGVVGFDLITFMDVAAFVSAGGYHHHLAFNTWQGVDAPPPPPSAAGLLFWSVVLPSSEEVTKVRYRLTQNGYDTVEVVGGFEVRDPWQIATRFVSG